MKKIAAVPLLLAVTLFLASCKGGFIVIALFLPIVEIIQQLTG